METISLTKFGGLGLVAVTAVAPVVWGSTYAVTHLWLPPDRPLFAGVMRILPVGLLMLAWHRRLPRGSWWWRSVALGTLTMGLFVALLFVAATRLPSGLGATMTAVAPLVTVALAWGILRERATTATVVASLVGALGVVLLVLQGDGTGHVDLVGLLASVGAVTSASAGFVLTKRWNVDESVLVVTTWQLVAGGLVLLPFALIVEGPPPALPLSGWLALAYLGIIGSGVAYVAWFKGLASMSAGAVAVIGLLNPVSGTILGVVLLGEPFGPVHLLGLSLVLGSVVLAQPQTRRAIAGVRHASTVGTRHTVEACPSTTSP
ncbi:ABC transporter permease [Knoellia flava TL1]|uniref:ABC transporter permease n=2 Tax=Knoellia flava TaxID=913969 RepID=A0A8H9KSY9_9MICO|nr:EamA family transporter [Knoellia flava]KGN30823.1 ABC transporter permease [Knoellia flava TL1]GGB84079.1 ABC transporter permease [Knoellia flava]